VAPASSKSAKHAKRRTKSHHKMASKKAPTTKKTGTTDNKTTG
jgi:hypothetical protein